MPDLFDLVMIRDELSRNLTGEEPPGDLVDRLGGWPAIAALAPTLVDDPLLAGAVSLLVRAATQESPDGDANRELIRPAAMALTDAVLGSTDPIQFAHNLGDICGDHAVASVVGPHLAAECLILAAPPRILGSIPSEPTVLRHAVALEAAARLAVLGHGSKNKLLGVLEDVVEPQPRRYALAVMRTVSLAFDHWSIDSETANVIDVLTGVKASAFLTAPTTDFIDRNNEYCQDIAADAMWTRANVELALGLRCTTLHQLQTRLDSALEALAFVNTTDDRDDAQALAPALRLLRGLLASIDGTGSSSDASLWDASIVAAEDAAKRAREFAMNAYGLTHWSGDRKVALLEGWGRFAEDLAWLRDQLDRDSLYDSAIVLDDILAIYSASRSYDVTRAEGGVEHVVQILRPAVAGGFAARVGLLRHLVDHIANLRRRIAGAGEAGDSATQLRRRLMTAEALLAAARSSMTMAPEPPGKPLEQASGLPPLLAELLAPHSSLPIALADADHADLAALAAEIADLQAAADLDPDLTVTAVRRRMLAELAGCEDFGGDVAPAVTRVLDQLIKFVARRLNTQESTKSYLFKDNASEQDLHEDLYDWLSQGQLSSATNVEVQEVGAGRVDIQIGFRGFHLYLELKVDASAVPVAEKGAYIQQTVSYQASDVRIGFLVVLRLKSPKNRSPSPHLSDLVSHAVVEVPGVPVGRHVFMLEVPGNQTKPSSVH